MKVEVACVIDETLRGKSFIYLFFSCRLGETTNQVFDEAWSKSNVSFSTSSEPNDTILMSEEIPH